MLEIIELLIHFAATIIKLLKPGGVKVVMAETMVMKQQLIVMNRCRKRAPSLATSERFLFGCKTEGYVSYLPHESRQQEPRY